MKLLESQSLVTGTLIKHKPWLLEKFFPLNVEKYITLQTKSAMPAKDYDYIQDVVDILFPILEKENIKIILLGDKNTRPLNKVINLSGQTSLSQSFYLVKRALLHLGNESILAHIAGAENIPLVELFGPTSIENHSPYFYNKEKTIFLEPERKTKHPTYNPNEIPKTINTIPPEDIASAVLKLLNLENKNSYKTLFIGQNYQTKIIESVPNSVIEIKNLGIDSLILRCDFVKNIDENILINQLSRNKCSIIVDKIINKEILLKFRGQINQFVYIIDQNHDVEFAKFCSKLGVNFVMLSYESPEFIQSLKLDYCEIGLIHLKPKITKKDIKELQNKENIKYKSSKFTISGGKIYPSKSAIERGELYSVPNFDYDFLPVIDEDDFWNEAEYFHLIENS